MADETTTTETVKTASDGSVKITIEAYQELMAKANEPKNVNVTRIVQTPVQHATNMVQGGNLAIASGLFITGVGVVMRIKGLKELAAHV